MAVNNFKSGKHRPKGQAGSGPDYPGSMQQMMGKGAQPGPHSLTENVRGAVNTQQAPYSRQRGRGRITKG